MKPKNLVRLRLISQLLFFIFLVLFITGAVCAFSLGDKQIFACTLGMLQLSIASRTLIMGVVISGLVLVILTLILGRVFCSWICPFGTLLDWLENLLKKLRLNKANKAQKTGKTGLLTNHHNKYGVLAGALISAGILRSPAFCTICPIGGTCRAAGLQGANMGLEALFIPLIAGLSFIQKRFWCKFLCPVGAILALTDRFSFLKVKLPAATCLRCGRCEKVCSMDIAPWINTHKAWKKDELVLDALMETGLPDFLDRPAPFKELPQNVQNILTKVSKKYSVPGGECTHCYECTAACPVLNQEKAVDLPTAAEKPLSA